MTLTALCLFYVYLRHRSNPIAFLVIAVAAIPIAVLSNFVRVLVLVLVTYYLGDAAAQGFLHDFAGLLMFAIALLAVFGVDSSSRPCCSNANRSPLHDASFRQFRCAKGRSPQVPARASLLLGCRHRRLATALEANRLSRTTQARRRRAQAYRAVELRNHQRARPSTDDPYLKSIYTNLLTRVYSDGSGSRIMLLLAQSASQTGFLQIHRPETCYTAGGFRYRRWRRILSSSATRSFMPMRWRRSGMKPGTHRLLDPYRQLDAAQLARAEDRGRKTEFEGLIPDAILVRISTVSPDTEAARSAIDDFIRAMIASIQPSMRSVLVV